MSESYSIIITRAPLSPKIVWQIRDGVWGAVVFSHPYDDEQSRREGQPPIEVRTEYEKLIKTRPLPDPLPNIVELVGDPDDSGFDQPCAHGNRVERHAIYCHNTEWLYAPRKCHRDKTDPNFRHEDCPGFRKNEGTIQ